MVAAFLDRARADVARLSAKIFGPHAHHCEPGTVDERNDGAARAKGCNAPAHVNLHQGKKEVICMKACFNVAENGAGSYRLLAMNAMS